MTDDVHGPGIVCVPHVDWMYSQPAISLVTVSHTLPAGTRWFWAGGNSNPIAAKRNMAVRAMMERPQFEWMLFLDSDQIYPRDMAPRLFDVDADVAAGLVLQKGSENSYSPCAGVVTSLPEDAPPERPADGEGFGYSALNPFALDGLGTVEVDVVGSGCMLVRRRVLERLDEPWFVANERHRPGFNEDYNFCLRARREGFTVKVNTDLRLEHVGPEGMTVSKARDFWESEVRADPESTFWPPLEAPVREK